MGKKRWFSPIEVSDRKEKEFVEKKKLRPQKGYVVGKNVLE
jgi:hypothetical protein